LIGFLQPSEELNRFICEAQSEFKKPIRYLQEYKSLGTGGGIYHFRDVIRNGNPQGLFVLNGDTAGDFPLREMLDFHTKNSNSFTILGTEATENQSINYGCIVADKQTHEVLHYVEKPESYESTMINCGIYLFSLSIFDHIREELSKQSTNSEYTNNLTAILPDVTYGRDNLNLETKIFPNLASSKKLYVFKNENMWSSIKSAGYDHFHFIKT